MGKILKGILVVMVAFVLLALLFGSPEDTSKYNAPVETQPAAVAESSAAAPAETQSDDVKVYSVGDRVVSGDIAYTITDVQTTPTLSNDYSSTSADGVFLIVDMDIENIGKETITMSSNYVKLFDTQERVFESDSDAWMYIDNENNLLLKQLQPGLKTWGRTIFDVPKGGTYGAMVTGSIWGGDEQFILIGAT